MTMQPFHKRNYHPLVCILYMHGMLTDEQIKQIPKTTRHYWNNYDHEDHFGYEWIFDILVDFVNLKAIQERKYLKRTMKFAVAMSNGFHALMADVNQKKSILRKHKEEITWSIQRISRYSGITAQAACKLYGVTTDWYYRHKNKVKVICKKSAFQKCFRQYPNQLTLQEMSIIQEAVNSDEYAGMTKATIFFKLLRKGVLFCGYSTFCKYANQFGYKTPEKYTPPRKQGIKASRVFEWLHIDVTHIQTLKDGLHRVAMIKDNFSKAILHMKSAVGYPDSELIRDLLKETFDMYGLSKEIDPIHILSDGGSENKGKVLEWVAQIPKPPEVFKITARTEECPQSNSMIESAFRLYKTGYMKGRIS